MSNKLFVGNLAWTTTDGVLQDTFAPFGNVVEAAVMMDKFTGKSRGFAFVTMAGATEGNAAMTALNGKEHGGRALTVNEAKPR